MQLRHSWRNIQSAVKRRRKIESHIAPEGSGESTALDSHVHTAIASATKPSPPTRSRPSEPALIRTVVTNEFAPVPFGTTANTGTRVATSQDFLGYILTQRVLLSSATGAIPGVSAAFSASNSASPLASASLQTSSPFSSSSQLPSAQ